MRSIEELKDVKGLRVLVRASLDVPIQNGEVADGFRLEEGLPTISYLLARGARVIVMGHIGRDPFNSLEPVYDYLKKKINISFSADICGAAAHSAAANLKDGEVLLLENLRRNPGEKNNDPVFAKELASLADIYVNDAFTVAHRVSASMVGVPQLMHSYAGLRFIKEVQGLSPALHPESPSLAIVGGAKLETKVALLHSLVAKYDYVFVGGALANDFFAAKGWEVGKSLVSGVNMVGDLLTNSKIILPEIVTVESVHGSSDKLANGIEAYETIWDIPPVALEKLAPIVEKARSILWNGPMGNFEKGFTGGTDALAKLIATSKAQSIVGGGDTLSSIQNLGLMEKFTFVSTAGGAMLDFLANGTLPGIEALESRD